MDRIRALADALRIRLVEDVVAHVARLGELRPEGEPPDGLLRQGRLGHGSLRLGVVMQRQLGMFPLLFDRDLGRSLGNALRGTETSWFLAPEEGCGLHRENSPPDCFLILFSLEFPFLLENAVLASKPLFLAGKVRVCPAPLRYREAS